MPALLFDHVHMIQRTERCVAYSSVFQYSMLFIYPLPVYNHNIRCKVVILFVVMHCIAAYRTHHARKYVSTCTGTTLPSLSPWPSHRWLIANCRLTITARIPTALITRGYKPHNEDHGLNWYHARASYDTHYIGWHIPFSILSKRRPRPTLKSS